MAIKKAPWYQFQQRETPSQQKIRAAAKELQTAAPLRDRVRAAAPSTAPPPAAPISPQTAVAVPQPSIQPIPGTVTPEEVQTLQLEEAKAQTATMRQRLQTGTGRAVRLLEAAGGALTQPFFAPPPQKPLVERVGRAAELGVRPFQVAGALTGPLLEPAARSIAPVFAKPGVGAALGVRQETEAVLALGQQLLSGEITPRDFAGRLIAIQESKPILQQVLSELPVSLIPPIGAVQKGVKVVATIEKLAVAAVKAGVPKVRLAAGQQVVKIPGAGEVGLRVAGKPRVAGAAEGIVEEAGTKLRALKVHNSASAKKQLDTLEKSGVDVSDARSSLDEFKDTLRGDFDDALDFKEARDEAWDTFLENVDDLELPEIPGPRVTPPTALPAETTRPLLQTPQRLRGQAGVSRPLTQDVGTVPPQGPRGTMPSGESDDILEWFGNLIASPESVEAWERTLLWRSQVLAGRAGTLETRTAELIRGGLPAEEAIKIATRESLAGELPRITTNIAEVVSPEIRDALFAKVYRDLANEPLEMASTAEALRNALQGKPIPSKLGIAGGSARTRLERVFPKQVLDAMDGKSLDELIGLQMGKAPRGVSPVAIASERGATQLRQFDQPFVERALVDPRTTEQQALAKARLASRVAGKQGVEPVSIPTERGATQLGQADQPFVVRRFPDDPRTAFQKELDLQGFKLDLVDEPTGVMARLIDDLPPVDKVAIKQMMLIPENKAMMLRFARETGRTIVDVFNFIRGNMASGDVSWPRQMSMLIFGQPVKFTKAMADSLRTVWRGGADYAKQVDNAIKRSPNFQGWYDRVGGDFLRPLEGKQFGEWQQLSNLAEEYMVLGGTRPINRLAANLPWLRISARAHVTGINSMLWQMFESAIKDIHKANSLIATGMAKAPKGGYSIEKEIAEYARFLAAMSGRGPLGPLKSISPVLNAGFFSARLAIGRLISPRFLFSSSTYVRKQAWKNFITGVTGFSALMLGGERMGLWEVEKDPRSADVMKGRIGPIRFDPWGGWQQYAVLYARLLSVVVNTDEFFSGDLTIKSTTTGEVGDAEAKQLVSQFVSNKLSPGISNVLEVWTGKDFIGRDIDRADWKRWLTRNSPLAAMDIFEAFEAEGLVGSVTGATALFGAGVQVYDLPRWPELDVYYRLETSRERELYRRRNPENEAKLFIRGQFTTLSTKEAKILVPILMRQHNVSPVDVRGYEEVFGSLRLPRQRELQPVQKGQFGIIQPERQEDIPVRETIPLRDRVRAAPTPVGVR